MSEGCNTTLISCAECCANLLTPFCPSVASFSNGISVAFLFFRTCQEIEGVLCVKFTPYGCVEAQRVSGGLCNRTGGSLDIATYVVWESA